MKISYESDFIEFNAIYWGNHESHQFHLDHWLHFELTCEVHLAMLNRSKVLTLFCKIQSVWSRSGRKLLWKHLYLQSRDVGNWFREDLRSRKLGFAQKKWPPDPRVHHHFPHQNFHYIPFLHKQSPHHHYYYHHHHHHHRHRHLGGIQVRNWVVTRGRSPSAWLYGSSIACRYCLQIIIQWWSTMIRYQTLEVWLIYINDIWYTQWLFNMENHHSQQVNKSKSS